MWEPILSASLAGVRAAIGAPSITIWSPGGVELSVSVASSDGTASGSSATRIGRVSPIARSIDVSHPL